MCSKYNAWKLLLRSTFFNHISDVARGTQRLQSISYLAVLEHRHIGSSNSNDNRNHTSNYNHYCNVWPALSAVHACLHWQSSIEGQGDALAVLDALLLEVELFQPHQEGPVRTHAVRRPSLDSTAACRDMRSCFRKA